ncbi:hypothetical protein MTO96_025678 [Rhipicephalus appendiculatus]
MPMDLVPESGPTLPDDSPNEEPCKDVTVQTDLTMADLQAMQEENEKLTCSLHSVEQQKQHLSTASQALDTDKQRPPSGLDSERSDGQHRSDRAARKYLLFE